MLPNNINFSHFCYFQCVSLFQAYSIYIAGLWRQNEDSRGILNYLPPVDSSAIHGRCCDGVVTVGWHCNQCVVKVISEQTPLNRRRCRRWQDTAGRGVYPPNNQGAIPPIPFAISLSPFPLPSPSPSLPHSPPAAKRVLEKSYGVWGSAVSWAPPMGSPTSILVYSEREKFSWQQLLYGFLYTEIC